MFPGPENGRVTGEPPQCTETLVDKFWLLPGIYHAHAAGLAVFLVLICAAFCSRSWSYWPSDGMRCLTIAVSFTMAWLGLYSISQMNLYYLIYRKNKNPFQR